MTVFAPFARANFLPSRVPFARSLGFRTGALCRALAAFTAAAAVALNGACSRPPTVSRGEFPLPKDVEITKGECGAYGGFFVIAAAQEPKTFNPLISTDAYSGLVIDLLMSPLVAQDPWTEEPIPALAKSWSVLDGGRKYVFELREGAKFSDGEDITADDVVFTFRTIFAPALDRNGNPVCGKDGKPRLRYPSRYAGQYTIGGKAVECVKLDKYKVQFTTSKPYAPFLTDIGFVPVLPKHALEKSVEDGTFQQMWSTQTALERPQDIVSSGAFTVCSYSPGERLALKPNPHYWRADANRRRLPYIDFLIFKFVADANTSTILFATGQCDAAQIGANDYAWVKRYASTYDFTIYERGPDSGIFFLWFNQNPNRDPTGKPYLDKKKYAWFSNKNFRKAVMHAIDRDGIIKSVWFSRAQKLHGIISPANRKWYCDDLPKYEFDPSLSRKLLIDAGFKYDALGRLEDSDGNTVEFEFIVADGSQNSTTTATTFVENMKAIGIDVSLKFLDFGTIVEKIDNTFDYDAALLGFTGGGDPSGGKAIYRSDGFLHVWNPRQTAPATDWEKRIDAIMDAQEVEMDFKKRKALVNEMQKIFSDELPLIFLTTPISYSAISNKWGNVRVPPIGSIIWNLDELFLKSKAAHESPANAQNAGGKTDSAKEGAL